MKDLTIDTIHEAITSNVDVIANAIEQELDEYKILKQDESIITYVWTSEDGTEIDESDTIVLDLLNSSDILDRLNYDDIIRIIRSLGVITPLPKPLSPDDVCSRMVEFAKMVVSFDTSDYEVRLTDGDGMDDSYYIVCFIPKDEYTKHKEHLNEKLINFKVQSDINIIFQLDAFPKTSLNLTGSYFYDEHGTDDELLRGIVLSEYCFGNAEFKF